MIHNLKIQQSVSPFCYQKKSLIHCHWIFLHKAQGSVDSVNKYNVWEHDSDGNMWLGELPPGVGHLSPPVIRTSYQTHTSTCVCFTCWSISEVLTCPNPANFSGRCIWRSLDSLPDMSHSLGHWYKWDGIACCLSEFSFYLFVIYN